LEFVKIRAIRVSLHPCSSVFIRGFSSVLLCLVLFGCSKSTDDTTELRDVPSTWRHAPFYVLQTELSPAILIFSTNKYLSLFTDLDQYGLSAPSHLAFATQNGPRAFTNGTRVVADHMDESWLLIWFAGVKGWTNWDVPWAVFLQHKPASMKLDGDGLHLGFRRRAEHVILLPLYGSNPVRLGGASVPASRSRSKEITTAKWPQVLTKDVLMRIRYWAGAVRHFPISVSSSIDRGQDAVTIRHQFNWLSTRDDWNTRPVKLAPIPPPLTDKQIPAQFSVEVVDLGYMTPSGPYKAIQDSDRYDIKFPIAYFTNETHASWSSSSSLSATNTTTNSHLLTSVHAKSNTWPRLIWPALKTPTGHPWTFGHITPSTGNTPNFRTVRLSQNTQIFVAE
jgi:hypothetical protein